MPSWKKVAVSGSDASFNSLYVLGGATSAGGFTGSLLGTASYAITASHALNVPSTGYNTSASFSNLATWNFNHNLNSPLVVIQTFDSSYNEILPQEINLTDSNNATITFPTQESGYALASVGGILVTINSGSSPSVSASYAVSASFAQTASFASTASYIINASVSGAITNVDYIDFNTSATVTQPVAGRLSWNNTDGTLDLGMKGGNVTQQIGQETFYEVRNETTSSILNGTSLYANGVTAGSGRITVAPFVADGSIREVRYLGLATENISTGVNGFVTNFGYVRGLDTRGTAPSSIAVGDENWSVGDILYAHPTVAGKLTNVRPKHEIIVAIIIIRNQTSGVLFVRPSSYGHIDDLHDVNINTGSLSSGDLLVYDSGSDYWTNSKQLTGSYGLTGSLEATSFTGSLLGTASQAVSSSYALTASYVLNAVSASNAVTSSYALTASYVNPLVQTLQLTGSLLQSGSITLTSGSITMPDRPAFRVVGAGGPKSAVTALSGSYLVADYSQGSGWDISTGTFTAPVAGLYQVNVIVRTNSNTLDAISQLIVYKNNTGGTTGDVQIMVEFGNNTTMNHTGGSTISKLAVGDTLKMVVATGTISFDSNDNFSVAYLG